MAGASSSDEELEKIYKALGRYHKRMDEITEDWRQNGTCCPSCYSPEYAQLSDKVDRVNAWLKILKIKNKNRKQIINKIKDEDKIKQNIVYKLFKKIKGIL